MDLAAEGRGQRSFNEQHELHEVRGCVVPRDLYIDRG